MPARSRRILLNLFAIAYGLVAIAGPALHALPGLDHQAPLSVARDAAAPDSKGLPTDVHHDDCPVCNLQAQASILLDPGASIVVDVVAIRPPEEPPLAVPAPAVSPTSLRGPPAVA